MSADEFWKLVFAWCEPEPMSGCLLWTRCLSGGYAVITRRGERVRLHRVACALANGPPTDNHQDAAHRCDVRSCCSPSYMVWASRRANMDGTIGRGSYGELRPAAKLTEADVRAIWALADSHGIGYRRVALRLGLPVWSVQKVLKRKNWVYMSPEAR